MTKSKIKASQVHAYAYILKELKEKKGLGKNKTYTQQECLDHPEFKKYFEQRHPENIVEINEKIYYLIEAENERKKLQQALDDARDYYAKRVNQSNKLKVLIVTGIAGNHEEGFIGKSQYLKNGKWEIITENGIEITGLLSKQQIEILLQSNNPAIKDVEITEEEFMKSAENINDILPK